MRFEAGGFPDATIIRTPRQIRYAAPNGIAICAAMAKAYATDVAMKVTTDAVQLFGATGIEAIRQSGR